jgi:hypothetical protein
MSKKEASERVGAIHAQDGETVHFFGYGVLEGDMRPGDDDAPLPGGLLGALVVETWRTNPRIRLDSGQYVWGCECWWGPEARVKKLLAAAEKVVDVDIDELRKKIASEED